MTAKEFFVPEAKENGNYQKLPENSFCKNEAFKMLYCFVMINVLLLNLNIRISSAVSQ